MCQGIARSLPEIVKTKPHIGLPVLRRLLQGEQAAYRFDSHTRTKTVEGIVGALDNAGVQEYCKWLMDVVVDPTSDEAEDATDGMDVDGQKDPADQAKAVESKLNWAVDQLLLLVRKHCPVLPQNASSAGPDWAISILDFFALHGFYNLQKASKKAGISAMHRKPEPALSADTHAICASRLSSALAHLVSVNPRCRAQLWTSRVLATLHQLETDSKHVSPLFTDESKEARQPALKALAKVKKVSCSYMCFVCSR